jgi:hypothetical protein
MRKMSVFVESKFSENTDMDLIQADYIVSLFFSSFFLLSSVISIPPASSLFPPLSSFLHILTSIQ